VKITVIIMTMNAGEYIRGLLNMLNRQTVKQDEILVVDSESDDDTLSIACEFGNVKVLSVKRSDFDHGGSRDWALKKSCGDVVLFLTQDAVIGQDDYIERLISDFADPDVAMVCGRQKAKLNASLYERFVREFNYPDKKTIRTKGDMKTLGIKAFYMSDACSAYRRSAYMDLGGFDHPLLTNEDMLIAAKAIMKGYKTVYEPSAWVLHSHSFTCAQEFKRNFDVAVFMTTHNEIFSGIKINGEGYKLVKYVSQKLLCGLHFMNFLRFGFICVAKFVGNKTGYKFRSMSFEWIKRFSSMPMWWDKNGNLLVK
jgi:rhamnosyltransferase